MVIHRAEKAPLLIFVKLVEQRVDLVTAALVSSLPSSLLAYRRRAPDACGDRTAATRLDGCETFVDHLNFIVAWVKYYAPSSFGQKETP
jgi:hypothetical protein